MKVEIFETKAQASAFAGECFEKAHQEGAKTFGLATGSTPEDLYAYLRASSIDFSDAISINLDEYYGLGTDHPQSYAYFMYQHLFASKPFKASFLPDGLNQDVAAETARYDQVLADHPIDLQLLGLGPNGHIAFNEPGTSFALKTHLVELTPSTVAANQRFFDAAEDVPTHAYSMGIASIMNAKAIILLAFGKAKAAVVKEMVEGPVTEALPASILQRHPNATIILDEAAASLLTR